MTLKNILAISTLLLSTHSFASRLITCHDARGNHLTYSASSLSGMPMLSVTTFGENLNFYGNDQITLLQYHANSYTVDAVDAPSLAIKYNKVQFQVLELDQFSTTVSIIKVIGSTGVTARFEMQCTSKNVVS